MKTIGFPIPRKENENRRAITLETIKLINSSGHIKIEKGYGDVLGISDEDYISAGVKVVDRKDVFCCDVICNPKAGTPKEYDKVFPGQIIFGWIHAVQGVEITNYFIDNKLTGYAWEDMFYKGQHVFWENNFIAGEAAFIHALTLWGSHQKGLKVAIIGRGNVAQGAIGVAERFGFEVEVFNRHMEELLREKVNDYDIIINCVLWDVLREDHILARADVARMKKNSLLIDVSCDEGMGIETSRATTFDDPVYWEENVLHYVVDHTPSLLYRVASNSISMAIVPYLNQLIEGNVDQVMQESLTFAKGEIVNRKINEFQDR